MDFSSMRREYLTGTLNENDLPSDPMEFFRQWFGQASKSGETEPNAMVLSTASQQGIPSSRVVLLKGLDQRGFVFYTNYGSQKAQDITENPFISLLFYWPGLCRQIRIIGKAERVSPSESDIYFASRPRESQVGTWASPQSKRIESRAWLEHEFVRLDAQFTSNIPRPEHWGGYHCIPSSIEFWQGRPHRLHDRISYELCDTGWRIVRLSPNVIDLALT